MVESTAISLHTVIQTSTIILWTELFPKKRRQNIQGEILQSIFKYSVQWCFHILQRTTRNPALPQGLSSHPVLRQLFYIQN